MYMLPQPLGEITASHTTRKASQPTPSATAMSWNGSANNLSIPRQPCATIAAGTLPRNATCNNTYMIVDSVTERISAIGIVRCGLRTSPATETIGVKPRYAKMMPPAETAPSMPENPNGAKPCTAKLREWKKYSSTTTTVSGTTN